LAGLHPPPGPEERGGFFYNFDDNYYVLLVLRITDNSVDRGLFDRRMIHVCVGIIDAKGEAQCGGAGGHR
jgi:hypothetical protein